MALTQQKKTIEDLIQEREDVRKMFKHKMKQVSGLIDWIQRLDKKIEKLENKKQSKNK